MKFSTPRNADRVCPNHWITFGKQQDAVDLELRFSRFSGTDGRVYRSPCYVNYFNCLADTDITIACNKACPCNETSKLLAAVMIAMEIRLRVGEQDTVGAASAGTERGARDGRFRIRIGTNGSSGE